MSLPSIRLRLTRLVVAVALIWGLLASAVVWLAVREEVDELLDETLAASAVVLAGLLGHADPALLAQATLVALPLAPHPEHFAWQLVGPGGAVLLRSTRAPSTPGCPCPRQAMSTPPAAGVCTASAWPMASACCTWPRPATNDVRHRPRSP